MKYADGHQSGGVRVKPKPPPPFSLRLSEAEKALLKADAGSEPLGTYTWLKTLRMKA